MPENKLEQDGLYGRINALEEEIADLKYTNQKLYKDCVTFAKKLKKTWIHRRVVLDYMDDPYAPEVGTQAIVTGVDDIGDLLCHWDNGSGLKLIIGKDEFHVISSEDEIKTSFEWYKTQQDDTTTADKDYKLKCPRCGGSLWKEGSAFGYYPALSRLADVMVCSECGAQEGLIAAGIALKAQGTDLHISGASAETEQNLKRVNLKDWWLVRKWRGCDE